MKVYKTITIIVFAIALLVSCDKVNTGPGDDASTFAYPHPDGTST